MKQFICLLYLGFALVPAASAASCVSGSLANYVALGAGGCTIGADTLYDFQVLAGTGLTEIGSGAVTIDPFGGTYDPGLTATVKETASANEGFETMFTYRVSGVTEYVASNIGLSGSSETGSGGVSDIQNFCAGTFGPDGVDGCTGATGSLLTVDGFQNQDSTTFNAPGFVSLTDDLVISVGSTGTASGGTISDQLTAVPEPSTVWAGLLGIVCVLVLRLSASKRLRN